MTELEKIIIRKATINDLPEMLQLMDEALGDPTIDAEKEEQWQLWLTKFHDSRFLYYVAEVEHADSLVGWCRGGQTVEVHKIVCEVVYEGEIHNMFIRAQYQHRGIGSELWKIAWNDILLTFHPKNFVVWSVNKEQAHKFYSSLGGVRKEERKFSEQSISVAFVWHDLKLYEFTNFIIYK